MKNVVKQGVFVLVMLLAMAPVSVAFAQDDGGYDVGYDYGGDSSYDVGYDYGGASYDTGYDYGNGVYGLW
jgi:uncharacterized membrane protein